MKQMPIAKKFGVSRRTIGSIKTETHGVVISDIAMCSDSKCPSRIHCYRYRAKPNEYLQAWGPWKHEGEKCEGYQSTSGWDDRNLEKMDDIKWEKGNE